MVAQATGVVYFNLWLAFLLGLLFWIIDGVLLWLSEHANQRLEMISHL